MFGRRNDDRRNDKDAVRIIDQIKSKEAVRDSTDNDRLKADLDEEIHNLHAEFNSTVEGEDYGQDDSDDKE